MEGKEISKQGSLQEIFNNLLAAVDTQEAAVDTQEEATQVVRKQMELLKDKLLPLEFISKEKVMMVFQERYDSDLSNIRSRNSVLKGIKDTDSDVYRRILKGLVESSIRVRFLESIAKDLRLELEKPDDYKDLV